MKQRKKVEKGGSARKVKKNNNYKVCLGDRANVGQKDRNNGSNEEQLRTQENRLSLRSGRAGTPRFRGTVKLEDINLSPFSSE